MLSLNTQDRCCYGTRWSRVYSVIDGACIDPTETTSHVRIMVAFIRAIAELLSAIVWPVLAVVVVILFRPEIRSLLSRLRKGGGAEFDPIRQPMERPNFLSDVNTTGKDSAAESPFPRTIVTREFEDNILSLPYIEAEKYRDSVLVTIAARALLVLQFEQVESTIWKSQVELLTYLNSSPGGADREYVRKVFYQRAADLHPRVFSTYTYESYLGYLVSYRLVGIAEDVVHITDRGEEYLVWRVNMKRAPKTFG